MFKLKGIGITPGIAIGKAFVFNHNQHTDLHTNKSNETDTADEINKFNLAVLAAVEEVESFLINQQSELHMQEIEILDTQIEFLNDPQIKADVLEKINNGNKYASEAVREVIDEAVL
jgi:phosphoenolpyruvate-protein phosphotransferase (PTS system enzyme I)